MTVSRDRTSSEEIVQSFFKLFNRFPNCSAVFLVYNPPQEVASPTQQLPIWRGCEADPHPNRVVRQCDTPTTARESP